MIGSTALNALVDHWAKAVEILCEGCLHAFIPERVAKHTRVGWDGPPYCIHIHIGSSRHVHIHEYINSYTCVHTYTYTCRLYAYIYTQASSQAKNKQTNMCLMHVCMCIQDVYLWVPRQFPIRHQLQCLCPAARCVHSHSFLQTALLRLLIELCWVYLETHGTQYLLVAGHEDPTYIRQVRETASAVTSLVLFRGPGSSWGRSRTSEVPKTTSFISTEMVYIPGLQSTRSGGPEGLQAPASYGGAPLGG